MARIVRNEELDESSLAGLSRNDREWIYNALDCCVTHEIVAELVSQMDNVAANTYAFSKALQAPILEMTLRGTRIDIEARAETLALYKSQIARIENQLNRLISEGVGIPALNWRSPVQLVNLFYNVMGYAPVRKRNAQGRMVPTANREAIEKLSVHFYAEPICKHLLKLRDLEKKRQFLETELDADGRIRTNFNIAGTKTGRLASSISDYGTGGNVQNVDRELRRCFIADPGMKFCNADLEQADARNVGAICWNLFVGTHGAKFAGSYLDACEAGDLHTYVCRMAWAELPWTNDPKLDRSIADGIAYRDLSYRDLAKRLGHGTNYLGTPRTMAKHSRVPVQLIEDFQRRYFRAFPCIKLWHERVRKQLGDTGSLTTLFGRRRFFFGRSWDDKTLRDAVAYEPQSCTADQIDTGILRLWQANRIQLLIQVHDSILLQFPEQHEKEIVPWVLKTLQIEIPLVNDRKFFVPTDAKVGWNWADANEKNPSGLIKWKGEDLRPRPPEPKQRLSVRDLL